ncbi:MAG: YciI family protein [Armatimonadota bacterium]
MPKFLVAIQHPENYDGSQEGEDMMRAIDDLNDEMVDAGIRIFVGGLGCNKSAKSLRSGTDGMVHITDGPYLETKVHVGGFWVLEVPSMDDALEWGRKAVIACRVPVEVRQFLG